MKKINLLINNSLSVALFALCIGLLFPNSAAAQCAAGESEFQLDLLTDNFGGETTWELRDAANTLLGSGGPYASATNFVENVCIPCDQDPAAYTFTIFDSFGDGICCGFGIGMYSISEDGNNIPTATGGAFGSQEATSFGTACAAAGGGGGGGGGGAACQILCPDDITVSTDAFSACDAYVTIDPAEVTGNCDLQTLVNDYNGTQNASDTYPVGTTTVCFDIIDNTGAGLQCCFDVTVIDNTAPVFTSCPGNMTINLSPGQCEAAVSFDVIAVDECVLNLGPATSITQNNVVGNIGNSVACPGGDYQTLQAYNMSTLGAPANFLIQSVDVGIFQVIGAPNVTLNLYSIPSIPAIPGMLNYANMTLLTTETVSFAGVPGFSVHNIPLSTPIAVAGNSNVVIELATPGFFFAGFIPGYNSFGLTQGTTYLASTFCNEPQPNPVSNILFGFTDQMVYQLNGAELLGGAAPVPVIPGVANQFESGDAFPIGGPYCLSYTAVDAEGNQSSCSFCITVKEFAGQTNSLACNDHVQISLDENCESIVGADDILEGGPYGCYDDYTVNLFYGPGLTNPVPTSPLLTSQNVGQTLIVQVVDPEHPQNNSCWGTLSVEDKIIPALECSDFSIACNDSGIPGTPFTASATNATAFPGVNSVDNGTATGNTTVTDFPGASITDVDVAIESDHTWVGDLQISITSPSGTTVELLDNWNNAGICGGCAGNGLDVIFDDEATATQADLGNTCNNNPAADGSFQAKGLLSAFDGEPSNGNWTVTVGDLCGGDGGVVTATLIITSNSTQIVPFPLPAGATISPQDIANGSPYTVIGFDPCGPVTLSYVDSSVDGDCVNDDFIRRITRTWTAVDASGNNTSCQDHIEVTRSTIADVVCPTNWDGLNGNPILACNAGFATDANGHPHPSVTGYPQVNGQNITSGGACEFAVEYEDQVYPICEGTYKIIRTWTILAWCPTTDIITCTQVIKVVDNVGPSITCPANMVVSTSQNDCTASVNLPLPTVSDVCSPTITLSRTVSQGFLNQNPNGTWTVYGLPLGTTTVTYTATDGCGNTSTCSFNILVRDQVAPIAICESFHVVGLTVDEPTLVPALIFDDGSYDNCELVSYKVRRMDNPNCPGNDAFPLQANTYSDYVPFYCCDVGGPNVMIELRVGDGATPPNYNYCMIEVEVQDKLNPAITCPGDKVLDCYGDPYDLAITGVATASDNCSAVVTHVDQGGLDNCGEGTVFRIWTATDPGGRTASCVQRIDVVNSDPFEICDTECWTVQTAPTCPPVPFPFSWTGHTLADDVEWPCDISLSTCGPGLSPAELELNPAVHPWNVRPRITEDGCDLVAVTYQDLYLPITAPACVKVLRTWIIIDWCQYQGQGVSPGYWEYEQIIKVLESAPPVIDSDCTTQAFCSYDANCQNGPAELILEAHDDCTEYEDLNFYYWIDLNSNGVDEIHAFGNDASGTFPLGTHTILWHVEDGCGNVSICEYQFIIDDCKKPTPYAYNGLAIEIMPVLNMVELWAVDFDAGSFDNCGIAEFRIASPSGGPGQTTPPPFPSHSVTFDCDDLGTQTVDLWVLDINGNWDYVSTYVLVQDNQLSCSNNTSASIAGTIDNEEGEYVEDVNVDIDGTAPGMPDPAVTGVGGGYGFPGLAANFNYVVTPVKDVNPLNGVTTYDLVLISKHILGIENLNSPYKMIAADINASGSISTIDMVELRKMILFIDTEFQNNNSWRFVDAGFVFPNANNPFATSFPEIFSVNGLNAAEVANFVGVKTGDVNGSAIANFAAGGEDRNTVGDLVFNIDDVDMVAGEQYTVDFQAKDFANLLGYQFTLAFDKDAVEFVDVEAGKLADLNANNFGMSLLEEGVITTSWNATQAVSMENADVVFSVTFTAKSNTKLSEVLAVNSRYTAAEAYDNNADVLNIGISFNNGTVVAGDFDLYQNQPNPFKAETVIGFNLPAASNATLTVYDVSGKVLKLVKGEFAQGYNEVTLNRAELSGAGVLYYQLDTDTDSATKKMILID